MANNIAFQPMGKTVNVAASGAANTESSIVTVTAISPVNQYLLSNEDLTYTVYVWISPTSPFNVSIPDTSGNGSYVVPVMPGKQVVITGPQVSSTANVYARVIGDGANATCYVTPGEGL